MYTGNGIAKYRGKLDILFIRNIVPLCRNHDNIHSFGSWKFVEHNASDRLIFITTVHIMQLF